jgi:hypothetical protein
MDTLYLDFGCRRPDKTENGMRYGIFSAAVYKDEEDRKCIFKKVFKADLWEDDAYITAIQSYAMALEAIYQMQPYMMKAGIRHVMLRNESALLLNIIANPRERKKFTAYAERANKQYKCGAVKEIKLGIGLCDRVHYERSRKYCQDKYVTDDLRVMSKSEEEKNVRQRAVATSKVKHVIQTGTKNNLGVVTNTRKTIYDMIEDSVEVPEIDGFAMVDDFKI